MDYSFHKHEKLCHKTHIDSLFESGLSFFAYPFRCLYSVSDGEQEIRVLISVSKRLHKHAVTRNLIKRRIREAYRLNKHLLTDVAPERRVAFALIYTSKEIIDFTTIENGVKKAIASFRKSL